MNNNNNNNNNTTNDNTNDNTNNDDNNDDNDDDQPIISIKVQNVVATVNFGMPVDLDKISQTVRNAEYNPKRFQAVILRIREPRTTALLFASGKMICTGAKTISDCRNAAMKYAAIITKVGYHVQFNDFKVQNITATSDAGFPIRLEALIFAMPKNCTYEPELFPGLIYRLENPKVVFLIFVSGKVVLTGAKDIAHLTTAFEVIFPTLSSFRKRNLVVMAKST